MPRHSSEQVAISLEERAPIADVVAIRKIAESLGIRAEVNNRGRGFKSIGPWIVEIQVYLGRVEGWTISHAFDILLSKLLFDPIVDPAVDRVKLVIGKLLAFAREAYGARSSDEGRRGFIVLTIGFEDPETGRRGDLEIPLNFEFPSVAWEELKIVKIQEATLFYIEAEGGWITEHDYIDRHL